MYGYLHSPITDTRMHVLENLYITRQQHTLSKRKKLHLYHGNYLHKHCPIMMKLCPAGVNSLSVHFAKDDVQ